MRATLRNIEAEKKHEQYVHTDSKSKGTGGSAAVTAGKMTKEQSVSQESVSPEFWLDAAKAEDTVMDSE